MTEFWSLEKRILVWNALNVKKIVAVINATYAVAKRKPEKIRLAGKADFFRLSFRNCISCVNNCDDLLYIYFFIPQFKYMNVVYSYFRPHVNLIKLRYFP